MNTKEQAFWRGFIKEAQASQQQMIKARTAKPIAPPVNKPYPEMPVRIQVQDMGRIKYLPDDKPVPNLGLLPKAELPMPPPLTRKPNPFKTIAPIETNANYNYRVPGIGPIMPWLSTSKNTPNTLNIEAHGRGGSEADYFERPVQPQIWDPAYLMYLDNKEFLKKFDEYTDTKNYLDLLKEKTPEYQYGYDTESLLGGDGSNITRDSTDALESPINFKQITDNINPSMIKEINSLACNGGRSFDQDPSETNINKIYPSVATPAMYGQAPYTNVKKVTMQPPLTYGMRFPLNLTNTTQRQQYIDNGDKFQEIEVKKRMDDKTKSPTLFRSKAALPHKYIKDETGNWQDMGVSNEY